MSVSLKRRVEALEAALGSDHDVTLEEIIGWSMHQGPYDAETQRQYEDFNQRLEPSRLGRLIQEGASGSGHASEPRRRAMAPEPEQPPASPVGPAKGLSLEQPVTRSYRDHPPTPMEKPGDVELSQSLGPSPAGVSRRSSYRPSRGLSLEALMMRERSPAPAPARAAFDGWVNEAMRWPEPSR